MDSTVLSGILVTMLPILLSLSVHEFAHARTALAFGDHTARLMGRCTLNPLHHLDVIGTLVMVKTGFGWAKPVPVNPANLEPRRLGDVAVSLAGPASNFGIALVCAMGLRAMYWAGVNVFGSGNGGWTDVLAFMLAYTAIINLNLMLFNLLPLYPLDGHHIGRETLPGHLQGSYMRWQHHYGVWILLALIALPFVTSHLGNAGDQRFDPLGSYLQFVMYPMLHWLTGTGGWLIGLDALGKFQHFLLW